MNIRDYSRVLRKGWPVVLAFIVLGSALGIALTVLTTKVYQASVQIFVANTTSSSSSDLAQGNTFTTDRVQSYTSSANSPSVTRAVITSLKLKLTRQQLAAKITADAPQDKVLINLHVTDTNPKTAAVLANAVAARFDTVVENDLEQTGADGNPVVKLTVTHPASVPTAPIKPSKTVNIGLGFALGLLLGVGVVVLRDVLDNTVKGPQDFEEAGIPVLGLVPFDKRTPKTPIAFRSDPHGARSEAYRQLRTNMQFINVDDAPKVIAVTSAVPGEGKTTTAINLAAALAEGGYRVCLIEADLRRPNIARALGLVSDVGFTTALIGKADAVDVLQNAGRNLAVLTCGPVPPNPSELLITEQANMIIRQLAATVDYTIIDTAPLLPVADGAEVAAMADATIVVHHAGKSTRDQAARSVEALAKVGERPVGVVLNMMSRSRGSYDGSYGYYYTYRPDKTRRPSNGDAPLAEQIPEVTAPTSTIPVSEADETPQRELASSNGSSKHALPTNHAATEAELGAPVEAASAGERRYSPTGGARSTATANGALEDSSSSVDVLSDTDDEDLAPRDLLHVPADDRPDLIELHDEQDIRPAESSRSERWRELRARRSR